MSVEAILAGKGREVLTIGADRTLGDAVSLLNARRIGAAVVVDGRGRLAGIVSERDVMRALAEAGGDALAAPVSAYMTRDVTTCTPATAVGDVMGLMTRGKFRHLPVLIGDELGGIISIGDIVKFRIAEVEAEHRAMRDYIASA